MNIFIVYSTQPNSKNKKKIQIQSDYSYSYTDSEPKLRRKKKRNRNGILPETVSNSIVYHIQIHIPSLFTWMGKYICSIRCLVRGYVLGQVSTNGNRGLLHRAVPQNDNHNRCKAAEVPTTWLCSLCVRAQCDCIRCLRYTRHGYTDTARRAAYV